MHLTSSRKARSFRLGTLLVLGAVALSGPVAFAAGDVDFVTPRHLSTVLGPSTIELRVQVPDGVEVQEILITVDERPLTTLSGGPPWTVEWDAGDGTKGRTLEALLILSDGSRNRAIVRTSALRINQVEEVGLVNLYPIVLAPNGKYVSGLEKQAFEILEDSRQQEITRFSNVRRPLRVGIVLDTSLSMRAGGRLDAAQKAAKDFLGSLEERDEGIVVTFNDQVQVVQESTSDLSALRSAIESAEPLGGTALYDAVWRTSKTMETFEGRRVMILLSDGKDESASGIEPGSLHTLEEALDQALRSEVMIFAIGLGKRRLEQLDFARQKTLRQVLDEMAEATGGRALISPGSGQLRKSFRAVAEDLRNQYSIAYRSTNSAKDGSWRSLQVRVPGQEAEVVCRKGYFAPLRRETAN